MCRPSSLAQRMLIRLLGLLACVALPFATAGCSGESAGIAFTFPGNNGKDGVPSTIPFYDQIAFSLSKMSGTSDEANQWNRFRDSWKAPTWNVSDNPFAPFPTIDCPKDSNGWSGFRPAPGAPSQISPYLHVKTSVASEGNVILEGRFPIHVACGREAFSIFLSSPWSLSPWRSAQEDQVIQRFGHRVTRIADGRYILTGGASTVAIGGNNSKSLLTATTTDVDSLIIYEPSSNSVARAKIPALARAFHSAIWNRDSILISGGIGTSGLVQDSYTLRFTGKTLEQLSAQEKSDCGEQITPDGSSEVVCLKEFKVGEPPTAPTPIAFQETLRIPDSANTQEAATIQIGGVKSVAADGLGNGDFHSLFHAATYLPGKDSVLVTGGFYYNRDAKVFQATNFIYELNIKDRPLKPASIIAVSGMSARAGHTAVRLDDDNVLLIGGVFGVLGPKAADNKEGFGSHTTAELLTRTDKGWTAKALTAAEFPPEAASRAFHSAMILLPEPGEDAPPQQLLFVTGGTSWSGSPASPGNTKTQHPSFIIEITKEGSSFKFQHKVPANNQTPKTHSIALATATMLETGQILYLGGTRSIAFGSNRLTFRNAAPQESTDTSIKGLSALFNPGTDYGTLTDPPATPIP